MKKTGLSFLLPLVLLASSTGLVRAGDDLRSVQEELRRRSLYFGDVDGKDTAELHEATKRYQARKGFASTGKPDRETLRSLGLVPRSPNEAAPRELDWPAEPVLPSDEKIDAAVVAKALHEETGIASTAISAKKETVGRKSSTKRRNDRSMATVTAVLPNASRPKNSPVISPAELSHFANEYFSAMGSNDIKRQLKFYADNVEYYRNGKIDRRIIEQTLLRYQTRWPSRHYTMGGQVRYSPIDAHGEIAMTFPVAFTLNDGTRTVKGATSNRLSISAATLDPRIASISEERVRH